MLGGYFKTNTGGRVELTLFFPNTPLINCKPTKFTERLDFQGLIESIHAIIIKPGCQLYPPSQKAPSRRAGMNAKRVSAIALVKADLLRRVPQKM
jgi:hypothetical protein